MWIYEVYGLRLQSDLPIDGLTSSPAFLTPDTFLDASPFPPSLRSLFPLPLADPDDAVAIVRIDDGYAVEYRDGTRFLVTEVGTHIRASWPNGSTPQDMATYLLGPLLAFVLRIRGVLCLHASAVVIDGRVAILAAPHGGGKSTTAALFAERGTPVMSDDVVPIHWSQDRPWAFAGYPRLRLWDETVRALYGQAGSLPRLTPTWDKRYLDLQTPPRQFAAAEHPVGAVFILGERLPDSPSLTPLAGHDAVMQLIANTSMGLHLRPEDRADELEAVARLIRDVPVYSACAADALTRLDEFCDLIAAAVRAAL